MSNKRPENVAAPNLFYNEVEARKYTCNSRMIEIQVKMCERAIELLLLPEDQPCLLLDIGCGSGLSGTVLSNEGHHWIGLDISQAMLNIAKNDREIEGDLLLSDMGNGVPFKPGSFDGAISISALQWLCNEETSAQNTKKRLNMFFTSLFASLSRTARAVFQFYPQNDKQIELITKQAEKAGFFGGVLIDYPNSKKAKKFFLVLNTGCFMSMPKAIDNAPSSSADYTSARMKFKFNKMKKDKRLMKKKDWILEKKERHRRKGKETCADSKYSGRKRRQAF